MSACVFVCPYVRLSNGGVSKITFNECKRGVKGVVHVTQHTDPNNPWYVVDLFVHYLSCIPHKSPFCGRWYTSYQNLRKMNQTLLCLKKN